MQITRRITATISRSEVLKALKAYFPNDIHIQSIPDNMGLNDPSKLEMTSSSVSLSLKWDGASQDYKLS